MYGVQYTWLDQQNVNQQDNISKYIYSFYFNTATIVTVGYGDIFPQTLTEKIMSIVCVLSGCGVFAYSISEVGQIFQDIQKIQKLRKSNIYIINNYLKQRRISNILQHKIRNYLEYYWSENEFTSTKQEQRIINQLSNNLKENLLIEANKIFILESPILRQNFSQQSLLKAIEIAQEQKYTPEENIFQKNDLEFSIFFIEKGSVEVYIEGFSNLQQKQTKKSQLILKQGQFFGEGSFFTGRPRKQTFRSLEFTTLIKIDRQGFLKIIKENKEDYEQFCYIKDQIILNGSTQFSRTCTICKSNEYTNHSEDSCPFIHFSANVQKTKTNLSISSQENEDEYEDDIFSIKQENKNQSQNSIDSFSLVNSLGSKNIKKVNEFSQSSNKFDQQQESHSPDKKKQTEPNKKNPNLHDNCITQKKLIQTNDTQLLYQMYFTNQISNQQIVNNQSQQKDKTDILDQNKLNIIQAINFQAIQDQDNNQRQIQKYQKKNSLSFNRNSTQDINYQIQDDFNVPSYKKSFSKLLVQNDDVNNYLSISQAYIQYRNQLNDIIMLENFDKMNIYEIYFPHNNYDKVLSHTLKRNSLSTKIKKQQTPQEKQKSQDLIFFNQTKKDQNKRSFSSKIKPSQKDYAKLKIDCSYKILLNGTDNCDKQINKEAQLNQQKYVSNNNSSFQENNEENSSQIIAPNRLNVQSRQSIKNRQSFFNRLTSAQSTKLKTDLSYQMQDKQEQNILQSE
ncbi:cyclic nucleotide-binding domain protein (macronuclear) [Tetrahymena thermophila SB210]|uniref:Cyclic nucleotide-binding domain protein n=1 Tax=Tetrahymena thermophila (strain SB210) TaxID=312017 RepID=Q235E4_TETTS|nr:cyclic nucleotide-binding domain protein [Tetrahymena thermophila SB210]EAR92159.3 cyclic nucleotide-binding domain protein [Tetrahymena thermophila SB210]|eukprot:XP_001012404.3 cyclic nucleotide-binding domain protein [Tetrahymena thermophila SB210]